MPGGGWVHRYPRHVSATLIVVAVVTAGAAALRSTWSPCGWSMLSTITPLTERARGHRFGVTAAWFVAGSSLGGMLPGLIGAGLAVVIGWVGLSATGIWSLLLVGALAAAALDAGRVGPALPHHRRQVSEVWVDEFRPWVYGSGFGVQIGCGLATYIMTGAVYLTALLAGLVGAANGLVGALAIGVFFGFSRGLAVLLGAVITTPARLVGFHRRFDAAGEPVRLAVIAVEVVLALISASAAFGSPGVVTAATGVLGVAGMIAAPTVVRVIGRQRGRSPMVMPASAPLSTAVSTDRREKDPMTA